MIRRQKKCPYCGQRAENIRCMEHAYWHKEQDAPFIVHDKRGYSLNHMCTDCAITLGKGE